jgi:hypothetical protein
MPFLTHDLPRGGRHVAPPAPAPLASARTRLRQLLPVGLLVAASSTAAVVMPMVEGAASADGGHSDQHGATTATASGQTSPSGSTQALTPTHSLSAAALSQQAGGKHRGPGLADTSRPSTASGGRHRADLSATGATASSGTTAPASQASQDGQATHAAKQPTAGATTAPKPTDGATPPGATPTGGSGGSTGGTGSTGSTGSSGSASSAPSNSPSNSPSNGNLVGTLTGTVGGVLGGALGGVGDAVGGLVGGS